MPLIALIISTIFEGMIWNLNLYIGSFLVLFGNILILKKNYFLNNFFCKITMMLTMKKSINIGVYTNSIPIISAT